MVGHFERASETERDNPITMKSEIVMKNSPVIPFAGRYVELAALVADGATD